MKWRDCCKKILRDILINDMNQIYLLLIIDIFLTVAAHLSLRVGALHLGELEFSPLVLLNSAKNPFLFLGLVLFAVSFLLYVFILSKLQLNVVYPLSAGAILILITLGSVFFLKETLGTVQMVGIATILIGIVLILLPK